MAAQVKLLYSWKQVHRGFVSIPACDKCKHRGELKSKISLIALLCLQFIFTYGCGGSGIEGAGKISVLENEASWIISYPVTGGTAEFTLNKAPVSDSQQFLQFISMVRYNQIPLTQVPYWGGVCGLVLLSTDTGWMSTVEVNNGRAFKIKYTNPNYTVAFSFSDDIPLVKITADYEAPEEKDFCINFIFWQAIGGSYNPKNRVVILRGEDTYYVINGQAEGIHYFPSDEYWSLRMGEENTPFRNITVGFVYKNDGIVQKIEGNEKPISWADWAMGQDLYLDTNNQYADSFDNVPYDLDKITNDIYCIYQEDEAGLFYSWMDTAGRIETLLENDIYHYEVYFWVGEDHWTGQYGENRDSDYRFMIDRYQDLLN